MSTNPYDRNLDETTTTNDSTTKSNDPTTNAFRDSAAPTITSAMEKTVDGSDTRAPSPSQSLSNRDIENEGGVKEKTPRRCEVSTGDESEKGKGKGSMNEIVVDWEGPNDPLNPKKYVASIQSISTA